MPKANTVANIQRKYGGSFSGSAKEKKKTSNEEKRKEEKKQGREIQTEKKIKDEKNGVEEHEVNE